MNTHDLVAFNRKKFVLTHKRKYIINSILKE